jgi:hypothetical protein
MKKRNRYILSAIAMISILGSVSISKVIAEEVEKRAIYLEAYYAGEPLSVGSRYMRICADATVINYSEFVDYYAYWSVSGVGNNWFFDRGTIETKGNSSVKTSSGTGKITYMGIPQKTGTCTVTAKASEV